VGVYPVFEARISVCSKEGRQPDPQLPGNRSSNRLLRDGLKSYWDDEALKEHFIATWLGQ
jgi:hypothetical protein